MSDAKKALLEAIDRLKASLVNAEADVATFGDLSKTAEAEVARLKESLLTYEAHLARMT